MKDVLYRNVQKCFKAKIQILILKSRHLIAGFVHWIDVVAHGFTHRAGTLPGHVDDGRLRLKPRAQLGLVGFHYNGVVQLDSSSLSGFFFEMSGPIEEMRGNQNQDNVTCLNGTCDRRDIL